MSSKNEKQSDKVQQDLFYLILDFLQRARMVETSESLKREGKLSSDVRVCDNIDLEIIFQYFIDFYSMKFDKIPKIRRKNDDFNPFHKQECFSNKQGNNNKLNSKNEDKIHQRIIKTSMPENNNKISEALKIIPISDKFYGQQAMIPEFNFINNENKEIKLLDDLYSVNSEFYQIAQIIMKEIISTDLNVHWNDIFGLEDCKNILQEAIIYPIQYPELFNGKFSSWKGILLYGPPGTGKTMLAKAVATECKWTFFNITASCLVSKWRGDSEKYIRVLWELARYFSPSIIFIDEIDWTSESNSNNEKTSEPVRRFRAELLSRLDGIISLEKSNVALLAATNAPWNLDAALLRRLEKHMFVDLPNKYARKQILQYYTTQHLHLLEDFDKLIDNTEHFSGSDLKLLCKEAWMSQTKKYLKNFDGKQKALSQSEPSLQLINSIDFLKEAQSTVFPTAKHFVEKYKRWENKKSLIDI